MPNDDSDQRGGHIGMAIVIAMACMLLIFAGFVAGGLFYSLKGH